MQVSLIGTGLMGTAMAERLMTLGHDVVLYQPDGRKMHGAARTRRPQGAVRR